MKSAILFSLFLGMLAPLGSAFADQTVKLVEIGDLTYCAPCREQKQAYDRLSQSGSFPIQFIYKDLNLKNFSHPNTNERKRYHLYNGMGGSIPVVYITVGNKIFFEIESEISWSDLAKVIHAALLEAKKDPDYSYHQFLGDDPDATPTETKTEKTGDYVQPPMPGQE